MDAKLTRSLRDSEARRFAEDKNGLVEAGFIDVVSTTTPVFSGAAADADVWQADVQASLIPIDLLGKRLKLHSIKFPFYVATGDTATYSIALYELLPASIGAHYSPSEVQLTARLLGGTHFTETLSGSGDTGSIYVQVHNLPLDLLLEPFKQYFVWMDKDSLARGSFATPSSLSYAYRAQEGSVSGGSPPSRVTLVRAGASQHLAPLVQLRSRYGSFIFGDPSAE